MPARPPTTEPEPPLVADFGDWLSPMVVKELRQGLRTRLFVGALVLLQTALAILLLTGISNGDIEDSTELFWSLTGGLLVCVMPLPGLNALSGEMSRRTFDLLALTHLSPLRIVAGKWLALISQSGLIVISILPYVVLRYFGGGVDLAGELTLLLFLWLYSALVTAFTVMVSAIPSIILRALFVLGGAFGVWPVMEYLFILILPSVDPWYVSRFFYVFFDPNTGERQPILVVIAVALPVIAYFCYSLLELAATASALATSAHAAVRKRLLSLLLATAAVSIMYLLPSTDYRRMLALWGLIAVATVGTIDCLTEPPSAHLPMLRLFRRRGRIGRWLSGLFAPGWPTGILFSLLLTGMVCVELAKFPFFNSPDHLLIGRLMLVNIWLSPIAPLAAALIGARHYRPLLGSYFIALLAILVFSYFLAFVEEETPHFGGAFLAGATPLSAFLVHYSNHWIFMHHPGMLRSGLLSGILLLAYLIYRGWPYYRSLCSRHEPSQRN